MKKNLNTLAGIFFYILFAKAMFSQNVKMDSLDNLINNSVTDTTRINLVLKKLEILSTINLDSAINLALNTLEDAKKIDFYKAEVELRKRLVYNYSYKGNFTAASEQLKTLDKIIQPIGDSTDIAALYSNWGLFYGMQSKYDSSIYYIEKSIRIYERNGNKNSLRKNYSNLAIGYQQKSNFSMALFYQQKALKICEENNNESGQAYTLVNMANTYINLGDFERAESTFLKTIELAKKMQLINVELYAYTNLSSMYSDEEKWQESFDIAMKAAELGGEMGDQGIHAASLAKASRAMVNMGQAQKGVEISQKAIEVADLSGQPLNINQAYSNMGYALLSKKEWKAAIPFYERAFESLEDADIYTSSIGTMFKELSICYEKTGGYNKALDLYKQYAAVSDSIRSKENIQKATELTMNYEFEKKEQSTKDKQATIDEITQARQKALIIGLVLSIIIILGALIAFYNKKKANALLRQQKKEIESTLTKLKTTQTQLIQSEKMASLGELTAGIAHEIQNPLNFVNNFSELSEEILEELAEEIPNNSDEIVTEILTDLKQNLNKITTHGKRASNIVKGMLEHSRTSSGIKELTDVNALADEFLRLSYHGLRAKDKTFNANFKTDFDTTLPKIEVIPQDLGRVILNLINNAFYACAERSRSTSERSRSTTSKNYKPTVTVSTKKIGDAVEIRVKDNGSGIPKDIKEKIFQPFFTTKPTGEGTGLGLSLAYDIITKGHGGELKVESKEGEGSEFMIQIPF